MTSIMIVGDSYGVPNFFDPLGPVPEEHISHLLRQQGFTVVSCAENGASLCRSIQLLQQHMESNTADIDYVLWFHTQLWRSRTDRKPVVCDPAVAAILWPKIEALRQRLHARMLMIGGSEDLSPDIRCHIQLHWHMPSWRRHILDLPLIPDLDFRDGSRLAAHEIEMFRHMRASEQFWDNAHPGAEAHRRLAHTVVAEIQRSSTDTL